jgi:pyruvate/2-oxoglutarate dehydrogenase complex dihydrolipoamide acyltransferase (E2) component
MKILQELIIPQESVNDDSVVILDLHFKNGDFVKKGDIALEFETSKANVSIEVMQDGYIFYECTGGDEVNVGSVVAKVLDSSKITESTKTLQEKSLVADETIPVLKTIFSKKAEALLIEKGLKESDFSGKDFVNEDDVLRLIGTKESKGKSEEPQKTRQTEIKIPKQNVSVEKISTQKKREIEYLSAVQSYGLNSTVSVIVEAEKVLAFVNDMPLLKGSFLPIIIYELARLLKKYPKLNSFFADNSIVYYNEVNLGIAMDMDKGLKVLKMSNPNQLSILEIERAIIDLSRKYYEDKSTVNDVSDITFTVTDLSGSGINSFFPLINKNNSGILAISSLDQKFKRINLSVTFDHRVTEGKYAASFLFELKTKVESYFKETKTEDKSSSSDIRCYKCRRKLDDTCTFLKVIDSKGKDQILCHVCYDGY